MKNLIKIVSVVLVLVLLAMTFAACGSTAVQGEAGINGTNGIDGKDGRDGIDGKDGKDGIDGKDGKDGKSAYELAVENGYSGTLNDWLFSLKGADGNDGTPGASGATGATGAQGETGVGVKDVSVKTVANGFVFTFTFTDDTTKSVLAATPAEKIETTTTTVNNGTEDIEVPATKEEIEVASEEKADSSATLPEGVALDEGTETITLTVKELDEEAANTGSFAVDTGAETIVLEIKIEEVHENNETPIKITIGADTVPAGLESVGMFHSGEAMTAVASLTELDAHNEFYYDKENGGITLMTKSFSNFTIVSGADKYIPVTTAEELLAAIDSSKNGEIVRMMNDITIDPATLSNAYGATGLNIKYGQILDGNNFTLTIKGADSTWDTGINITGGEIKNINVTGPFRGVFINHNSTYGNTVVLNNVTIDGTVYTISCDQGLNQTFVANNSTFKGWTSYAATVGSGTFTNCYFGEGSGYAYCRPYAPTAFINCEFEEGFEIDPCATIIFEKCTLNGVDLTEENLATLVTSNIANASVVK